MLGQLAWSNKSFPKFLFLFILVENKALKEENHTKKSFLKIRSWLRLCAILIVLINAEICKVVKTTSRICKTIFHGKVPICKEPLNFCSRFWA